MAFARSHLGAACIWAAARSKLIRFYIVAYLWKLYGIATWKAMKTCCLFLHFAAIRLIMSACSVEAVAKESM